MAVTFAALSKLKVQVGMLCKDSSGNEYRIVDVGEDHIKYVNATTTSNLKKHNLKSTSSQVPIVEPALSDPPTLGMVLEQGLIECNGGMILCPDVNSSTGGWIAIWDLESYDGDLTAVPTAPPVSLQGSPWHWKPLWDPNITPPVYEFASRQAAIEAFVEDVLQ